jgi:hypothetical protein
MTIQLFKYTKDISEAVKFLSTLDKLNVPFDGEFELTAVLSDVSVEPIECGNHIPHGEHFDLIVNTHECQP